ncbi:MAG: PKD domain-containing protein [Saprospiraceae bacterium]
MTYYYPRTAVYCCLLSVFFIFSSKINAQNFCQAVGGIITVTNTNDTGSGSLREAITCANEASGPQQIHFNLTENLPHIIYVGSSTGLPLPNLIDDGTVIDGSTQNGFSGEPLIILDGSQTTWDGPYNALHLLGDYCEIYGLTIRYFPDDAIDLNNANHARIGAIGKGNVIYFNGIYQDIFPGFSGSWEGCGIVVRSSSDSCRIQGNTIGTNFDQTMDAGNEYCGIIVRDFCLDLKIGGLNNGEGNVIANNPTGIRIDNSYQISIRKNSMYCNDTTAIRLLNNGNFEKLPPIIDVAQVDYISGTAPENDAIDVFVVDDENCEGVPCQGKIYLGTTTVVNGIWYLPINSSNYIIQPGDKITTTATTSDGTTSTFSDCRIAVDANNCAEDDGTIWVTNTDDDGPGTLRAAINCANNDPDPNVIKFNIPDSTIQHRIYVGAQTGQELPALLDEKTTIDGTTQSGFGVADFAPKIILDGSQNNWTVPINAIWIRGNHCEIYGLEIVNFPDDGIDVRAANFAIIGAPNKGNVIINNGSEIDFFPGLPNTGPWEGCGIVMRAGASFCTVQGNFVGTNYAQDSIGGNEYCGVIVQSNCQGNVIGGDGVGEENVIAYNELAVRISASSYFCRIQQNSMYCNEEGIKLLGNGNQFQIAPTVDSVSANVLLGTGIPGDLIEVFINDTTGCTNVDCQGKTFLGTAIVSPDSLWNLSSPYPSGANVYGGAIITATATDSMQNTSPFSNCLSLAINCNSLVINFENVQNATCGLMNGSFEVVANGGFAPYVYDFGNGATSESILDSLSEGIYYVTVTDNSGCERMDSIEILTINTPVLSAIEILNENCGQANGAITLSVTGGTPPFLFDIGNGSQSNPIFENLIAGVYPITFTDATGCQDSIEVTLENIEAPLLAVANVLNENCNMSDGAFTVIPFGGAPPFQYDIGNGPTGNPNFTGLSSGFYTVVVTDDFGCSSSISVVIFDAPPILAFAINIMEATCGLSNGSFEVFVSSGLAPFSFDIGNGPTNNNTFTSLSGGDYQVTVTDFAGCSTTINVEVGNSGSPSVSVINIVNENCGQEDGSFEVAASGGTPPYTYNIGAGNTSNPVFANLNSGIYNIILTDANNCSTSQVFMLGESEINLIVDEVINANCGIANGSISVSSIGGIAPILFDIGNGLTTNSTFQNLVGGTYNITVTDAIGCTDNQSVTVLSSGAATFSIINVMNENCGQGDGSFEILASGGMPPYSYNIGMGTTSNPTFSNLNSGTYTVIVTDSEGCNASQIFMLDENEVTLNIDDITNATCGLENGSITVSATGGMAPYIFNIGNGSSTNPVFENLAGGTYTITVTDGNGCDADQSVAVLSIGTPILSIINVVNENCGQGDGSFEISTSGGTPPYTYDIGLGAGTNPVFSNLNATEYNVIVTDATGCTASQVFNLPENIATLNIVSTQNTNCGLENGIITVSTTGGTSPFLFDIGNGNTSNPTFENLSEGTYNITLTDINGCTDVQSATIESISSIIISFSDIQPETCGQMNGGFTVNATGGVAPYSFDIGSGTTNNNIFTNLSIGNYIVTVTDDNGCQAVDDITIEGANSPSLILGEAFNETCSQMNGAISMIGSGGEMPYTYDFGNGPTSSNVVMNLSAGIYTVTITDDNGCTGDLEVTLLNIGNPANASYTYNNNVFTVDFTSTSVDATSHLWDFGDGNTSTEINPTHIYSSSGSFEVCLTVSNSCSNDMFCEIIVVTPPENVEFDLSDVSGEAGDTVYVEVAVENFENMISFQKSIQMMDTTVAQFIGVTNLNLTDLSVTNFTINNNIITADWMTNSSTGQTVVDGTIIYELAIKLLFKIDCSQVIIDDNPLPIAVVQNVNGMNINVNADVFGGEVCVTNGVGNSVEIAGLIFKENGQTVANVDVTCLAASIPFYMTNSTGAYEFLDLPQGGDYTVTPFKNDAPENGLTALDLALIQQHILGTNFLTSPYQIIAADANNSGTITALDLVVIQNVIIGNSTSFPNNTSWRFVPEDYIFPDPMNPFSPGFPEEITLYSLGADSLTENFIAIKTGDVNLNSTPSLNNDPSENLVLLVDYQEVSNDGFLIADFKIKSQNQFEENRASLLAWQMDLEFDPAQLIFEKMEKVTIPNFNEKNIGTRFLENGILPIVWVNPKGQSIEAISSKDEPLFSLKFKVKNISKLQGDFLKIKKDRISNSAVKDGASLNVSILLENQKNVGVNNGEWNLISNYPNPFNEFTLIKFDLIESEKVTFLVYDLNGQLVYRKEEVFEKGKNEIRIDETNLPNVGLYNYQLQTSKNHSFGKMIFMK